MGKPKDSGFKPRYNREEVKQEKQVEDPSLADVALSAAVGAVTDNGLLGGIVGGSFLGGFLGDLFNDGDWF